MVIDSSMPLSSNFTEIFELKEDDEIDLQDGLQLVKNLPDWILASTL
jgi:hypothetical protein